MKEIDLDLFVATIDNNLPEVRRLLSAGADANASAKDGFTPLGAASMRGHAQVVKELVEHGADIEEKAHVGWTALHSACYGDHLAVVIELLSPSNGTTNILGKRKSRGANIEAKDRDGDTPLHLAIRYDYWSVVKALLSGGADILAVNTWGHLPIRRAGGRRRGLEASKYLLRHFYAATRRLPLHKLLEDLTWIDNLSSIGIGVPPLRAALDQDGLGTDDVVEILEYLVERNPELLSSRDDDGSLPLHLACRRGASFPIIQSLVNRYKASVKSVNSKGDLPLFLACETPETSLDTIFILMKHYPDVICR
jgi:ankyrin repeat protein